MRSLVVILMWTLSTLTLTTRAAIQPSPVYHRPQTIVSSVAMGKSLSTSNNPGPLSSHANMQNIQMDVQQPIAEERQTQDTGVVGDDLGAVGSIPSAPQNTVDPQTFKIYYYPNTGPLSNPQGTNYQVPTVPQSADNSDLATFWEKYHFTDVIVGVFSAAMVGGGAYLLVPKLVSAATRGRSLRELTQDFNSDDAARLAKSVINAVERLYELNNAE